MPLGSGLALSLSLIYHCPAGWAPSVATPERLFLDYCTLSCALKGRKEEKGRLLAKGSRLKVQAGAKAGARHEGKDRCRLHVASYRLRAERRSTALRNTSRRSKINHVFPANVMPALSCLTSVSVPANPAQQPARPCRDQFRNIRGQLHFALQQSEAKRFPCGHPETPRSALTQPRR